ncbi:hypothetical protein [Rhodococcus sp. 14-2470-1b]|uniref:hypothetical protein n=1 Tax=Rhodococcus sp. 14-2470-1b TaxID=2023149 RepID=UPI0011400B44|nr:hypothetical protein [Rhodococcus sp. 14-2470-1b]
MIDAVAEGSSRRDVEFIGTLGELAAELIALPDYRNGVLRTVIPAPKDVTAAVAAVVDASPPLPDSAVDGPDAVAVLDVEVYSTRPGPIPNSRTEVGAYTPEYAHRIAEQLAAELGGIIEPMRNDTVLRVTHEAGVSDTDRIAVDRFSEVQRMRANLSVLDPVADAEYITALAADLEELQARSTPAARADNTAAVSAPVSVSNAVEIDRASTRPRGLVTPRPHAHPVRRGLHRRRCTPHRHRHTQRRYRSRPITVSDDHRPAHRTGPGTGERPPLTPLAPLALNEKGTHNRSVGAFLSARAGLSRGQCCGCGAVSGVPKIPAERAHTVRLRRSASVISSAWR